MTLLASLTQMRIYDLAQPLEPSTPVSPNQVPFRMALIRRHGDMMREDGSSGANELLSLGGHTGTHIDALSHVALRGKLHGGIDAAQASTGGRFQQLGVETIHPIVCRGILLDIPSLRGTEFVQPDAPITAADLEAACETGNTFVREGDAVLIRTGWPRGRYRNPELYIGRSTGVPGPNESAAEWLVDHRVRLTGADTIAYEWLAPGAGHTRLPVHVMLLQQAGIYIVEVMYLDELARDGVREFVFVLAPLKIVGATGSPVRPLALVE